VVANPEKANRSRFLSTDHQSKSGVCGGDSDGCFVFLLLSMPLLTHEIPLGKLGTRSTLYELGYMGSCFFIQMFMRERHWVV
jgi:hypothetical protein